MEAHVYATSAHAQQGAPTKLKDALAALSRCCQAILNQ